MIVMFHKVGWSQGGELKMVESSMGFEGMDSSKTAMAITVGLPLAIATKLVLTGQTLKPGVQMPITKEWYGPILDELEADFEVTFSDSMVDYKGY